MMVKSFVVILLIFSLHKSFSQTKLTLESAINIALKNNFDIEIAKQNVANSTTLNNIGVAGGLPTAAANLTDQENLVNINQKLNTGQQISRNNAASNNLNTNVTASMLLYNGYRVKATKKRLEQLQLQTQQQLVAQIQNTIATVSLRYYDVVRQQGYLNTLEKSIAVNQQQITLIEVRKDIGLANYADLFQAKIDFGNRTQEIQSQKLVLANTTADLLNILALKADESVVIKDTIIIEKNIKLDTILKALSANPTIQSLNSQILINQQIEKETAALRYPSLRANTGLTFGRNQATGGQLLLNQSYGPFIGIGITYPFYNSGVVKRQEQVAKTNTNIAQLQKENNLQNLQTTAIKAHQSYINNQLLIKAQRENVLLAEELVKLSLQRFQLGQSTILELRTAQQSFEDASYKLINISFAAKVAEINLKQLGNQL